MPWLTDSAFIVIIKQLLIFIHPEKNIVHHAEQLISVI